MTADEFLSDVVVPNCEALAADPSNLRLAVNAIMTADAFFGIHFENLKKVGATAHKDDKSYRKEIADRSECYRILRDATFSLKHGELNQGNILVRLVRRTDQVEARESVWDDDGKWGDDLVWADNSIKVEVKNHGWVRADTLVIEVVEVAKEQLKPNGRVAAKLADIRRLGRSILEHALDQKQPAATRVLEGGF